MSAPTSSVARPTSRRQPKRAASSSESMGLVSLKQLADVLGRDANTIRKWIEKGMPAVQRGDRDVGKTWLFRISDVVRWREDQILAEAGMDAGSGTVDISDLTGISIPGIKDPAKAIAATLKLAELAMKRQQAVSIAQQAAANERAMTIIRQGTMSISGKIGRRMNGFPPDQVKRWIKETDEICIATLEAAQRVIDNGLEAEDDE